MKISCKELKLERLSMNWFGQMRSTMRSQLRSGRTCCSEEMAQKRLIRWENLVFPVAHENQLLLEINI